MPLALPSGRGRRWIEERTAAGINQPNTEAIDRLILIIDFSFMY